MDASAIIRPGQKLLLQVTPPATLTPTPGSATATPTATPPPAHRDHSPHPAGTFTDPHAHSGNFPGRRFCRLAGPGRFCGAGPGFGLALSPSEAPALNLRPS